MSTLPTLPSYTEVTDALRNASAPFSAAELHGLMCGLICGSSGKEEMRWERVIGKNKSLKGIDILESVYEVSYHQMSEFSFEFSILLPEDSQDINQRAEALGLWCQGFLAGLEQSNIPLKNRGPSDLTDTLNDLIEIAQVNYEEITSNDEDESAYYELIEYVRLATLMIFHELRKGNSNPTIPETNLLH